jgi:cytochrome c oxidase subunit 2
VIAPSRNPAPGTRSGGRFAMTSTLLRLLRRLPSLLPVLAAGAAFALAPAAQAETRTYDMWWAPKCVTVGGHQIDRLLMFIFWLTLTVFILTQVVYIYFLVKYRARRGVKAVYSHGNNRLEIIWTTIPAVIFILLAVVSDRLWFQLRAKAPANALHIDIVAYQFGFHIRNPGADDTLGKYNQLWIEKGTNNFGVDLKDPASRDDYQSENQLTLPVNRPVNVALRSQDVIHAFYVPEFRMYQDIVPGREIDWVWFTPEKIGHWALACNQLCGSGHFNMQAKIDVVSQEDYDKLVKEKSLAAVKQRNEQDAKVASADLKALPARQNF